MGPNLSINHASLSQSLLVQQQQQQLNTNKSTTIQHSKVLASLGTALNPLKPPARQSRSLDKKVEQILEKVG